MLIKIIRPGVTRVNKIIPVSEIIETNEINARSLIAEGYAVDASKTVAENALKSPVSPSDSYGDKLHNYDPADATGSQQQSDSVKNNGTKPDQEADPNKIKKALNSQYTRDNLYEAAKNAGVEIACDAKKADIINAVVAQGKAAALLK